MSNTEMANIQQMAKGLQKSAQQAAAPSSAFMKFTKFGEWLFGVDKVEAEEEATWAVHPQSFQHGWIAWGDKAHGNHGEKLGDEKVPATQPLPSLGDLPEVKGKWNQQVAFQMLCLSGMDEDAGVIFGSSSTGGRRAYQDVVNAVIEKITAGDNDVVPVVTLESDSYDHTDYGKIFTPKVVIQSWMSLAALQELIDAILPDEEEEDEPEPEPVVEKKAKRKAKAKAKVEEVVEAELVEEEEEEVATPTRKKRVRRTR